MLHLLAIVAVAAVVTGAVGALVAAAGSAAALSELQKPFTLAILKFTLTQAALSTVISVAAALPLARALHRRDFAGRRLLIRLSGVALVIPSMVAVLGVVAVHGRGGWVNDLLAAAGAARRDYLYGLTGILIAHTFFNLPLATRIFLNALFAVPAHTWRLAALYGLSPAHIFRRVEWPHLRAVIPAVAGMIFLLCFTSFAIVLTLGGGPQATTLEVAVYQALRFEFDLPRAVALSLIQIGVCFALAAVFFARGVAVSVTASDGDDGGDDGANGGDDGANGGDDGDTGDNHRRHRPDTATARVTDGVVIAAAGVFLVSPLIAVAVNALGGGWGIVLEKPFARALTWTLTIAPAAGVTACILALALADAAAAWRSRRLAVVAEVVGVVTLLVPPLTLAAGLFLLLRAAGVDALSLGAPLVIILNALVTLAFAVRILRPPLTVARARFDGLCAMLGVGGWNRWRWVLWPALRRPAAFALAVTTTLAAGDMGVIALFGTADLATLPLLMYRLIGAYRLEQAAVVAAVLCALCWMLFVLIERGVGGGHTLIKRGGGGDKNA